MEGGIGMASDQDIEFMRVAIEEAVRGRETPGGAEVGAVLVRNGQVICKGFNEGEMRHDPTAHSEMVVIRKACEQLKTTNLEGTTLYCTLQPCGMCTMASLWAGISRIEIGARRSDVHAVYFESRHNDATDFIRDAFRNDLEIEGGVLAGDCSRLYAKPHEPVEPDPAHKRTAPAF